MLIATRGKLSSLARKCSLAASSHLLNRLLVGSPAEILKVSLQAERRRAALLLVKLRLEFGVCRLQLCNLVLQHLNLLLHEGRRTQQAIRAVISRDVISCDVIIRAGGCDIGRRLLLLRGSRARDYTRRAQGRPTDQRTHADARGRRMAAGERSEQ